MFAAGNNDIVAVVVAIVIDHKVVAVVFAIVTGSEQHCSCCLHCY